MGANRPHPTSTPRGSQLAWRCARLVARIGIVTVFCVLFGCASNTHGQLVAFLRAHEQAVATGHYTVLPPDAITIHAPVSPEVDGVTCKLRPDGKISLRLLGEVDVAGLTTEQIAEKLREQLARFYVDPEVVVGVATCASQYYYVFGEGVGSPGRYLFTGRNTLLSSLAEAGLTRLAWRSRIRVVRPSPDEEQRKVIIVDLDHMVRSGDVDQNFLLQPGDIVEVPPTPLAWVGLRVRDLLYPVSPVMQAYNTPADVIDSTHHYENEFGDGDNRGGRTRRRR